MDGVNDCGSQSFEQLQAYLCYNTILWASRVDVIYYLRVEPITTYVKIGMEARTKVPQLLSIKWVQDRTIFHFSWRCKQEMRASVLIRIATLVRFNCMHLWLNSCPCSFKQQNMLRVRPPAFCRDLTTCPMHTRVSFRDMLGQIPGYIYLLELNINRHTTMTEYGIPYFDLVVINSRKPYSWYGANRCPRTVIFPMYMLIGRHEHCYGKSGGHTWLQDISYLLHVPEHRTTVQTTHTQVLKPLRSQSRKRGVKLKRNWNPTSRRRALNQDMATRRTEKGIPMRVFITIFRGSLHASYTIVINLQS